MYHAFFYALEIKVHVAYLKNLAARLYFQVSSWTTDGKFTLQNGLKDVRKPLVNQVCDDQTSLSCQRQSKHVKLIYIHRKLEACFNGKIW